MERAAGPALVSYYLRLGYARPVIALVDEAVKRRGADPQLLFWRAFAYAREGNHAAAIRDAEAARSKAELEYPALLALRHYHKGSKLPDTSALAAVEAALLAAAPPTDALPASLCAEFTWLTGGTFAAATGFVDRVLMSNPNDPRAALTKGWICATAGCALPGPDSPPVTPTAAAQALPITEADTSLATINAPRLFDTAISITRASGASSASVPDAIGSPSIYVNACMGYAHALARGGRYSEAANALAMLCTEQPWFAPAYIERAKVLFKSGEWEGAAGLLNTVLEAEPQNIEALRLAALYTALVEGPGLHAVQRVTDIKAAIEATEPKNHRLAYDVSRVFARLSGPSARPLLSVTLALVGLASKLQPECVAYWAETGLQRLLAGDLAGAAAGFSEAAALEEGNTEAAVGLINLDLLRGQYEDAGAKLDLYRLAAPSDAGRTGVLALVEARLAWRRDGDREAQVRLLAEALDLHMPVSALSDSQDPARPRLGPTSLPHVATRATASEGGEDVRLAPPDVFPLYEWYYRLDPGFMLEVGRELLQQPRTEGAGKEASAALANGPSSLVDALTRDPPHPDASRLAYDDNGAPQSIAARGLALLSIITSCVPAYLPAWLLSAVTHAACDSWDGATSSVNHVIELDPTYIDAHLLSASIALQTGNGAAAMRALDAALGVSFSVGEAASFLVLKGRAGALIGKAAAASTEGGAAPQAAKGPFAASMAKLMTPALSGRGREDAIASLERAVKTAAWDIPFAQADEATLAAAGAKASTAAAGSTGLELQPDDRARLLALLIALYAGVGAVYSDGSGAAAAWLQDDPSRSKQDTRRLQAAKALAKTAAALFAGTPQEALVAVPVAFVQHTLLGDVDGALATLAAVPLPVDTSVGRVRAYLAIVTTRAEVTLHSKRDRRGYLQTFRDVLSSSPAMKRSEDVLVAYGKACMGMGELEEAVKAYETAVKASAASSGAASEAFLSNAVALGQALVRAHEYARAVAFYRSAVAQHARAKGSPAAAVPLEAELAALLVRMGQVGEGRKAAADLGARMRAGQSGEEGAAPLSAEGLLSIKLLGERLAAAFNKAGDAAGVVLALRDATEAQQLLAAAGAPAAAGASGAAAEDADTAAATETARMFVALGDAYEALSMRLYAAQTVEEAAALAAVPGANDGDAAWQAAAGAYKEGLRVTSNSNIPSLLALARLALSIGDSESCRTYLATVTAVDPSHEDASLMLSDLLVGEGDLGNATHYLTQLLASNSCNYPAMYRLQRLMRRAGRLQDMEPVFAAAVKVEPTAEAAHPGFQLVKGLWHRWAPAGDAAEAVRLLNAVRLSPITQPKEGESKGSSSPRSGDAAKSGTPPTTVLPWYVVIATEALVDLYLSPDGQPLWSLSGLGDATNVTGSSTSAPALNGVPPNTQASLAVAARLLEEMPARLRTPRHDILAAHVDLAHRTKPLLESALARLTALADGIHNGLVGSGGGESGAAAGSRRALFIAATMGLAAAWVVAGFPSRAKSDAKKALKAAIAAGAAKAWADEEDAAGASGADASTGGGGALAGRSSALLGLTSRGEGCYVSLDDDTVRAWLLLADLNIDGGKFDAASEALNKALELDGSCARAYQYLGAISERQGKHDAAADLYRQAWTMEGEASVAVGFKLGLNYVKCRRFVDAIDTAHKVLKLLASSEGGGEEGGSGATSTAATRVRREILDAARRNVRA